MIISLSMPFFLLVLTNPVQPSVAFLYPLKPSENLWIKFCEETSLNAAIKVISYYVKSVQIRSFISPYSVRMRENTDQKKFRIWTFHMV